MKLTAKEQKMIDSLKPGQFVYIERDGAFYYVENVKRSL